MLSALTLTGASSPSAQAQVVTVVISRLILLLFFLFIAGTLSFFVCHHSVASIITNNELKFPARLLTASRNRNNCLSRASSSGRYFKFSSVSAENLLVPLPARPSGSVPEK